MPDIHRKISAKASRKHARTPKLVVDPNLFVSGFLNPLSGKPAKLIDLLPLRHKRYQLLVSRKIFEEYEAVLNRFERISSAKWKKLLAKIRAHSNWIKPKKTFTVIKEDPDDDKFLECAVAGKADFIVSGDKHLLALKEFRGVKIITIDKCLTLL